MNKLGLALVLVTLTAGPCVAAESISEAMATFGLVGTWAPDCASQNERFTFASSTFGGSTMTEQQFMSTAPSAKPNMLQSEIRSAARITEDKLQMVAAVTKINGNAMPADAPGSKPVNLLFQKVQNKLVLNNQVVLEKCLN